ncbi:hypothetical protein LTR46_011630, partial [Exophiala xenobiotica]
WSNLLLCAPVVTFKDPLYDAIVQLGTIRPTPHPQAAMPIQVAINILVDVRRFSTLLQPHIDINIIIKDAQDVAIRFITQWRRNPRLASQTKEVHTMHTPARTFWRVFLSAQAAAKAISQYSADETLISITPHNGQPTKYSWDQVTEVFDFGFSIPTPPNSPTQDPSEAYPEQPTEEAKGN